MKWIIKEVIEEVSYLEHNSRTEDKDSGTRSSSCTIKVQIPQEEKDTLMKSTGNDNAKGQIYNTTSTARNLMDKKRFNQLKQLGDQS